MKAGPDNTALRVALWRALHVLADAPPHVFDDTVGLALVAPDDDWQKRPDMGAFTRPFRASIVARARFVEDLVEQHELGLGVPPFVRFVPVNFERGDTWRTCLDAAGFDATRPAVIASTGVSMYLTKEAVAATLRDVAALAPGSTLVMSFMLPIELAEPDVRPGIEAAARGARASGTPWLSFFTPAEMLDLARAAGFRDVAHVSADALTARYFAGRTDGLRLPSNSEELLVATTSPSDSRTGPLG